MTAPPPELRLTHLVGFSPDFLEAVGRSSVVYRAGNQLAFVDVKEGSVSASQPVQLFQSIAQFGSISAFAFNRRRNLIAVAEKCAVPKVFLYSFPELQLLGSISEICELEIQTLDFSRDGSKLAILTGVPDFRVLLWDLEENCHLCEGSLEAAPPHLVKVNPVNDRQLISVSTSFVHFWNVESLLDSHELSKREAEVFDFGGGRLSFECACWASPTEAYVGCADGQLLLFDSASEEGTVVDIDSHGGYTITSIVCTIHHVITSCEDGFVRFFEREAHALIREVAISEDIATSHLVLLNDFSGLVVLSKNGSIVHLPLPDAYGEDHGAELVASGEAQPPSTLMSFHHGPIRSIACLPDERPIVFTAGEDKRVLAYDYANNRIEAEFLLDESLTCVAVSDRLLEPGAAEAAAAAAAVSGHFPDSGELHGDNVGRLLAVASRDGYLRIFDIGSIHHPELIFKERVGEGDPIRTVAFDIYSGNYLAAVTTSGFLSIMEVVAKRNGGRRIRPLCSTCLEFPVTGLSWNSRCQFYVADNRGEILLVHLPPLSARGSRKGPAPELQLNALVENKWRLDYPVDAIFARPDAPNRIVAVGVDRKLHSYLLPSMEETDDFEADIFSEQEVGVHDKRAFSVTCSMDMGYIVSGGSDGTLAIAPFFFDSDSDCLNNQTHDTFSGGVSCVAVAQRGRIVFSSGNDGILCGFTVHHQGPTHITLPFLSSVSPMMLDEKKEELDVEEDEEELTGEESDSVGAFRADLMAHIRVCQAKLDALLQENEEAQDIEKLDRMEFLIDEDYRNLLVAEGDQEVAIVREEIHFNNLAKSYLSDKIKKECWDTMEEHLTVVEGINLEQEVNNYPLPFETAEEGRFMARIISTRRVELYNFSLLKERNIVENLMEQEPGVGGVGASGACTSTGGGETSNAGPSNASGDADSMDEEDYNESELRRKEVDPNAEENLLYSPFELYTRGRRVTQIHLLKRQIRMLKRDFNKTFRGLQEEKHTVISKVEERNTRIREINEELHISESLFLPTLSEREIPESVLTVKDEEVGFEQFVSPEEQKRRDEEKKRQEERKLAEMGDREAVQRALEEMMHGQLEIPETKLLDQVLERPEWMMRPVDEMTEEEQRKLKEWEESHKRLEEEKERYRKQLESESRKLKSEIADIITSFDAKLLAVLDKKLKLDEDIFQSELLIIKLTQAVLAEKELMDREQQLKATLEELRTQAHHAAAEVTQFKREVQVAQNEFEDMKEEDKNMDKVFKARFADAGDQVDLLYRLFRRRAKIPQISGRAEDADHATLSHRADPFASVEAQPFSARTAGGLSHRTEASSSPDVLDFHNDRPPTMPEDMWQRFWDYRKAKIDKEKEIKYATERLAEMEQHLAKLEQEETTYNRELLSANTLIKELHQERIDSAYNTDFMLRIKQGQVEVEQAAVVTDYGNSLLIPVSAVHSLNSEIRAAAQDNIKCLMDIRDFRKSVRLLEWELDRLELDEEHFLVLKNEYYLLRMTKNMQDFLKHGRNASQESVKSQLNAKKDSLHRMFESKVQEKESQIRKLRRQIRQRAGENNMLAIKVKEHEAMVEERENIHSLQHAGADKLALERRLKDMRLVQQLKELSNAQNKEMMLLATELDRLRERTFPSFAVQRPRGNVDTKQ